MGLRGGITDELEQAAERLADARGESVDHVLRHFKPKQLKRIPARFSKHLRAVRAAELARTGVRDGLAYVELENGRTFFSPLSHAGLRREYEFVADTLPSCISEDTYLAAIDVVQRYLTDFAWPPEGLVPEGTARIIELGAYLGHKTVRFAEELSGNGGRVLAVEMMPENCEILRRNIDVNGFGGFVDVLPVGVWKEAGTVTVYSKGRQRNSIQPLDKLGDGRQLEATVQTLDQIIDGWGVQPVDLVFVTVNGAEVEVLEGFHPETRDVNAFFVSAPSYGDGERDTYALCKQRLIELDYEIFDVGRLSRLVGRRKGLGRTVSTRLRSDDSLSRILPDLSEDDEKALRRHLKKVPMARRGERIVTRETALRGATLTGEARHLIDTQFRSQFRYSRILHTANSINDFFNSLHDFHGAKVADLGPGQFAFAMIAKALGAVPVAVDKNEPFLTVAPMLGMEIVNANYYESPVDLFTVPFDGLWLKGSFSALIAGEEEGITAFAEKITGWIKPSGWGYVAPNNRKSKYTAKYGDDWERRMHQLVEHQRSEMERLGWTIYELRSQEDRLRYGMSSEPYNASQYIFLRHFES